MSTAREHLDVLDHRVTGDSMEQAVRYLLAREAEREATPPAPDAPPAPAPDDATWVCRHCRAEVTLGSVCKGYHGDDDHTPQEPTGQARDHLIRDSPVTGCACSWCNAARGATGQAQDEGAVEALARVLWAADSDVDVMGWERIDPQARNHWRAYAHRALIRGAVPGYGPTREVGADEVVVYRADLQAFVDDPDGKVPLGTYNRLRAALDAEADR